MRKISSFDKMLIKMSNNKLIITKNNFICTSQLKSRGWTDSLIWDYLGEPDKIKQNPHYRSGAPMKLYNINRIELIEKSAKWKETRKLSEFRKLSAKKASQSKRDKLNEYIDNLIIDVPYIPFDKLVRKACSHYNEHLKEQINNYLGNNDYLSDKSPADISSDDDFINRITVNYLRHVLSDYDDLLFKIHGKVGVSDGYIKLNEKIFKAISVKYPVLQIECNEQLNNKIEMRS